MPVFVCYTCTHYVVFTYIMYSCIPNFMYILLQFLYYYCYYTVYLLVLGVSSLANASRARQFNPLNPLGWGGSIFVKARISIRTCVPNLGAVRRERFLTIDNPPNPPWGGVGPLF